MVISCSSTFSASPTLSCPNTRNTHGETERLQVPNLDDAHLATSDPSVFGAKYRKLPEVNSKDVSYYKPGYRR